MTYFRHSDSPIGIEKIKFSIYCCLLFIFISMKKIILITSLALLASCTQGNTPEVTQTGTDTTVTQTGEITETQTTETTQGVVQHGDTVVLNYTLRENNANGTVIETTVESVAIENGLVTDDTLFGPVSMTATEGALIPGFLNNLVGMQVGETKSFTVLPEDGYGTGGTVETIAKEIIAPIFSLVITREELAESMEDEASPLYQQELSVGLEFSDEIGAYKLTELTDTHATFEVRPTTPAFNEEEFVVGYTKEFPQIGLTVTILDIGEETVTIEEKTPMTGKTLHFNVEVVEIQ